MDTCNRTDLAYNRRVETLPADIGCLLNIHFGQGIERRFGKAEKFSLLGPGEDLQIKPDRLCALTARSEEPSYPEVAYQSIKQFSLSELGDGQLSGDESDPGPLRILNDNQAILVRDGEVSLLGGGDEIII